MTPYNKTPWGLELTWADTEKYSSKVLIITQGEKTSYIFHKVYDSTLLILNGVVLLVLEGIRKTLNEGDTYHIPPRVMYQLIALKGDATILQTGTKLEDDIVEVDR